MDVRTIVEGRTRCPQCGEMYEPVLGTRKRPELLIQEEFPNAEPWEREQLMTGVCSDRCWNEMLGPEDGEDE